MKVKFCAVLTLFFFGWTCVNAQVFQGNSGSSNGTGDLKFGAKAGLNISTFVGDDVGDLGPKVGAYAGGMVEIPAFFENFYLQPELLISFQGSDIGPNNLNLNYIHLPIMAKYHFTEAIAAEFGPQIGFKIGDNGEDVGVSGINNFNAGLNLGGRYRLNENFYFQLRFGLGLSNVFDNSKLKNGVLSVGACYFL